MMFVGEYLKQARTKSKIKLKSVAKELNISIGYLQAIENNELIAFRSRHALLFAPHRI